MYLERPSVLSLLFSAIIALISFVPGLYFLLAVAVGLHLFGWDAFLPDTGLTAAILLFSSKSGSLDTSAERTHQPGSLFWLDLLPLPSLLCHPANGKLVAANSAAAGWLGLQGKQHQDAPSLSQLLFQGQFHQEDWDGLVATKPSQWPAWLANAQGTQLFSCQLHLSAASPEPDPLLLVQLSSVELISRQKAALWHHQGELPAEHGQGSPDNTGPYLMLDRLLRHFPFPVCITNLDGTHCWFASQALYDLLGVDSAHRPDFARWWEQSYLPADRLRIQEAWNRLFTDGWVEEVAQVVLPSSQKREGIVSRLTWRAYHNQQGNNGLVYHYFHLNELLATRERIPEHLERMATQKSNFATWVWNRRQGVAHWSHRFYRMHNLAFTYLPDPVFPFPFMKEETRFDLKFLLQTMTEEMIPLSTEYGVELEDGSKRSFILTISEVQRGENGETEYLAGLLQEVTIERELAAMQESLIQKLLQKQQVLKEFSATLSHRLRVPVAQLQGILTLMLNNVEIPSEQQRMILQDSSAELDKAIHEMTQLLNMENIISGIPELHEWQSLLRPITMDMSQRMMEARASLHVDFSAAKTVFGVKENIQGILIELLNNAIRFRDERRPLEIHVSTECKHGKVWLHVEDNGIGVNIEGKEDSPFELYRKFHSKRSGKGFGLHLVKLWTEMLNGRIWMTSQEGKGTKVSLAVPIRG